MFDPMINFKEALKMSTYYQSYNIESIKYNPFIKLFFDEDFTQQDLTALINEYNTVKSIQSNLGNFILTTIISEYNLRNGSNHNPTDYGIVIIPIDQNSKCAALIFPLVTKEELLIKTYIELGDYVAINFQDLGYIDAPDYVF